MWACSSSRNTESFHALTGRKNKATSAQKVCCYSGQTMAPNRLQQLLHLLLLRISFAPVTLAGVCVCACVLCLASCCRRSLLADAHSALQSRMQSLSRVRLASTVLSFVTNTTYSSLHPTQLMDGSNPCLCQGAIRAPCSALKCPPSPSQCQKCHVNPETVMRSWHAKLVSK